LSVVGCSILIVDGGHDQPIPESTEQPPEPPAAAPVSGVSPGDVVDGVHAAALAARQGREAGDAEALAGDAYLADALARLRAAVSDLAATRWSARGPGMLAAAARALAREQARLDAAMLRLVATTTAATTSCPAPGRARRPRRSCAPPWA
jgi:hypothetical protein